MITCFLVDDDFDDKDFFEMALGQINKEFNVYFAENGRKGLNLLATLQPKPDVIFVDLNMPLIGGLEFLAELKQTENKDIPVIIYSTSDEKYFQQKALESGASGYLVKSSTMRSLQEGIAKRLTELNLI